MVAAVYFDVFLIKAAFLGVWVLPNLLQSHLKSSSLCVSHSDGARERPFRTSRPPRGRGSSHDDLVPPPTQWLWSAAERWRGSHLATICILESERIWRLEVSGNWTASFPPLCLWGSGLDHEPVSLSPHWLFPERPTVVLRNWRWDIMPFCFTVIETIPKNVHVLLKLKTVQKCVRVIAEGVRLCVVICFALEHIVRVDQTTAAK